MLIRCAWGGIRASRAAEMAPSVCGVRGAATTSQSARGSTRVEVARVDQLIDGVPRGAGAAPHADHVQTEGAREPRDLAADRAQPVDDQRLRAEFGGPAVEREPLPAVLALLGGEVREAARPRASSPAMTLCAMGSASAPGEFDRRTPRASIAAKRGLSVPAQPRCAQRRFGARRPACRGNATPVGPPGRTDPGDAYASSTWSNSTSARQRRRQRRVVDGEDQRGDRRPGPRGDGAQVAVALASEAGGHEQSGHGPSFVPGDRANDVPRPQRHASFAPARRPRVGGTRDAITSGDSGHRPPCHEHRPAGVSRRRAGRWAPSAASSADLPDLAARLRHPSRDRGLPRARRSRRPGRRRDRDPDARRTARSCSPPSPPGSTSSARSRWP